MKFFPTWLLGLIVAIVQGAFLLCSAQEFQFSMLPDRFSSAENLYQTPYDPSLTGFVMKLLDSTGQGPTSRKHIKTLLVNEPDSDGIDANQTAFSLIEKSGFKYELYDSVSDDGYITQLIRLINPMAQRGEMKYPPVVIYGGQFATPAFFLMGPYQHPAPWPMATHIIVTSRSLAFTLSNNGYDVWLVPARGVDKSNQGRINALDNRWLEGPEVSKKQAKSNKYWAFGNDEIIQYEFKNQLEVVRKVSGQHRLSLVTYSNGGLIAFGFIADNLGYAKTHIDTLVSIAPTVYVNRLNMYHKLSGLYGNFLASMENPLIDEKLDSITRNSLSFVCKNKLIRYTACKFMLDAIFGHSDMFQTYFNLDLLQHIARPQSVKSVRHSMQITNEGAFKHFDYGKEANIQTYGLNFPPRYNLDVIDLPRLFIFTGDRDAIAGGDNIEKLKHSLGSKNAEHFTLEGYNHLDMIAAWDVDKRLNEPILGLLDERYTELVYSDTDSPTIRTSMSPKSNANL